MRKKFTSGFMGFMSFAFPLVGALCFGTVQACDDQCERLLQQKSSDARSGQMVDKERADAMRRYEQHHQNTDEFKRLRSEQMKKMAMRDKIIESNGQYKPPEREGDAALKIREEAAAQVAERNKRLEQREAKYKADLKEWESLNKSSTQK